MRDPVAAGTFYERDGTLLKGEIDALYEHPRGPGSLPLSRAEHKVKAIIAPNSPYTNCGACMAWSYKMLAETPLADVYIILATNQHSQESGISMTTFNTPLGMARIDQELGRKLVEKGTISVNEEIHSRDHVIEVQLPFLLHAKYHELEHVKILPMLVSKDIDTKKLALDLKETMLELHRNAIFIVSTDMTHYGPLFHYVPFTLDIQENIYRLDQGAIDIIKQQNAEMFANYAKENLLNYHGTAAIETLLQVLRPCTVTLENYYTSGDVISDYKNAVAYAAIVFEEK
jgi:MEMO1 family protein